MPCHFSPASISFKESMATFSNTVECPTSPEVRQYGHRSWPVRSFIAVKENDSSTLYRFMSSSWKEKGSAASMAHSTLRTRARNGSLPTHSPHESEDTDSVSSG